MDEASDGYLVENLDGKKYNYERFLIRLSNITENEKEYRGPREVWEMPLIKFCFPIQLPKRYPRPPQAFGTYYRDNTQTSHLQLIRTRIHKRLHTLA